MKLYNFQASYLLLRECPSSIISNILFEITQMKSLRDTIELIQSCFPKLVQKYEQSDGYQKLLKYNPATVIKADKTLAVFLWFSRHEGCSFHDISDRFDISTSTTHSLIIRMITFVSNLSSEVIQ